MVLACFLLDYYVLPCQNKRTPLTTAAKVGNKKIVKLLLDNGASIETTGGDVSLALP